MKTDSRTLNLQPDVLIAGGGAAGLAAVVGAKTAGADVVLIEKSEFAGGNATSAYVATICGLYFTGGQKQSQYVARGFPGVFADELIKLSPYKRVETKTGLSFLPYDRNAFLELADRIIKKNVSAFLNNTSITEVKISGDSVSEVFALHPSGTLNFHPKTFVDTSGKVLMKNVGQIHDEMYQAAAHVFSLSGISSSDEQNISLALIKHIKSGVASGNIAEEYSRVSLIPGTFKNGHAFFKLGLPFVIHENKKDNPDLENFSHEAIQAVHIYLKQNSDLYKNSTITFIAPETGVRTNTRYLGRYMLTKEDVLHCIKSDYGVARGTWPIEFWEPGKNVLMKYFNNDDYYDIPYNCLIAEHYKNVFFAGKNISASDQAIASARVIGTCLQTGFAAGMMAAYISKGKPVTECIPRIQECLFENFQLF